MEWLLIVLAIGAGGGIGGAVVGRRLNGRRTTRREELEELEAVRRLADEDVTLLGEELHRLDARVSGDTLGEEGRLDYQRALDAYESAQRAVPRIQRAEEVSKITDTLSTGRYALACVQARVAGRPLPEHRVPCFFNPQHGPSARDVTWTQPGRGTRTVPACAQDAARIADGERPELRRVKIGSRMVPYWEAGAAYLPYGQGYFVAAGAGIIGVGSMSWAFSPPVEAGGGGGFSPDYGGVSGFGGGNDGGGFDGGGFGGGFDGGGGGTS